MRAMTSTNVTEIKELVEELVTSTNGLYQMHESFSDDDPRRFTRPWFSWADGVFGTMVVDLVNRFPEWMLKKIA